MIKHNSEDQPILTVEQIRRDIGVNPENHWNTIPELADRVAAIASFVRQKSYNFMSAYHLPDTPVDRGLFQLSVLAALKDCITEQEVQLTADALGSEWPTSS
ncbi:MAG: hypothetical protein ABL890_04770 [Candidatus Peribacteraceae bacterium]